MYTRGERILAAGSQCTELMLIDMGTVIVTDNNKLSLKLEPGMFLGDIYYFANSPANEDYYAQTEVTISKITDLDELDAEKLSLLLKTVAHTVLNLYTKLNALSPNSRLSASYEAALKIVIPPPPPPEPVVQPFVPAPELDSISENIEQELADAQITSVAPDAVNIADEVEQPVELSTSTPCAIKNIILPENFKTYTFVEPPVINEKLLLKKSLTCPACNTAFKYYAPAFSKVVVKTIDDDLRKHYVDFELLWYSVATCPNCYYSNYTTNYKPIYGTALNNLKEHLNKATHNLGVTELGEVTINTVLRDYYAALYTAQSFKSNKLIDGRLWMNLAWLYNDLGDTQNHVEASTKALTHYMDAYENAVMNLTPSQNQELCLVIAELYVKTKDYNNALRFFRTSLSREPGANKQLNQKAHDRIQDIRSESV